MQLAELIPDADILLDMPPEELAPYLLRSIIPLNRKENRANIAMPTVVEGYPPEKRQACRHAIMEAWQLLVNQGLLAPDPGNQHDVYFVSRRGREAASQQGYADLQRARLFPQASLHPTIAATTYNLYLRSSYDTAVFESFRAVEVAVRKAGNFTASDYGVALMRLAFDPQNGPLADQTEPPPERQALSDLFAGAIGRFKNPTSHRHIQITNPAEAVEMIQFASHLLRLVDQHMPPRSTP